MPKAVNFSAQIDELIERLRCLPGIGPKSAQRIAFHLLARNRDGGLQLAEALSQSMQKVQYCRSCRNFTELEECILCSNPHRNPTQLCVVENPSDVLALEQTVSYRGHYFVLQGHLSPLDGIGPEELGLQRLVARVREHPVKEVILATNSTVEGEITAHHIARLLQPLGIQVTRIAHGVPIGGELEYIDGTTLARAITARTLLETGN